MIKSRHIAVIAMLAATGLAHAETSGTTPLPGDQGITSVNRNLEKIPDNKGLQNASEQLERNRLKHEGREEKREERHDLRHENRMNHAERHDGTSRPERIERPAR